MKKLYLFIDEHLEVVFTSKKLVDAINLKKDNICVVSCCQIVNCTKWLKKLSK